MKLELSKEEAWALAFLHPVPEGEEVLKEGWAPSIGDSIAHLERESI